MGATLSRMGICLGAAGHHDDAMSTYRRAREVYEAIGGTSTTEYADLLRSMAARLRKCGSHAEAIKLYREAQTVLAATCSPVACDSRPTSASRSSRPASVARASRPASAVRGSRPTSACTGISSRGCFPDEFMRFTNDSLMQGSDAATNTATACADLLRGVASQLRTRGCHEEAMLLYREAQATLITSSRCPVGPPVQCVPEVAPGCGATQVSTWDRNAAVAQADLLRSTATCLRTRGCHEEASMLYHEAEAMLTVASDLGIQPAPQRDTSYHGPAMELARCREVHAEFEARGEICSLAYADLLAWMASCLEACDRHAEAMSMCREAKAVYQASGGTASHGYAELLNRMAAHLPGKCSVGAGSAEAAQLPSASAPMPWAQDKVLQSVGYVWANPHREHATEEEVLCGAIDHRSIDEAVGHLMAAPPG